MRLLLKISKEKNNGRLKSNLFLYHFISFKAAYVQMIKAEKLKEVNLHNVSV